MIWHPFVMGILFLDGITVLLVCLACIKSFQITADWRPEHPSKTQLRLEVLAENALSNVLVNVIVGGTDHAHVYGNGFG